MNSRDAERVIPLWYERLWARYGDLGWWPAKTPYEMMVGAVLTQNTAWSNVKRAIAAFGSALYPEAVAALSAEALAEIIRPSGFYHQKSLYLHTLTAWFAKYSYDAERLRGEAPERVRTELLDLRGIGPETADSILLYAFGFPYFVVDAYTKRLLSRMGLSNEKRYDAAAALFTKALPRDTEVYGHMHAMIVENAKTHCRAKPLCENCPLGDLCAAFIPLHRQNAL